MFHSSITYVVYDEMGPRADLLQMFANNVQYN